MSGLVIALSLVAAWMWLQGFMIAVLWMRRDRFGQWGRLAYAIAWPLCLPIDWAFALAVGMTGMVRAARQLGPR